MSRPILSNIIYSLGIPKLQIMGYECLSKQDSIKFKQLNQLIVTLVLATAILYLPATTLSEAGNGGWLSPVFSMIPSAAVITAVYILNNNYRDKTIVQYLPDLFGKFVGKIFGFILGLFLWSDGAATEGELSSFMHTVALPDTPLIAIDLMLFGLLAYGLFCGLQGLARVNELTYVTLIFLYIVLILGLFGSFHQGALYPLLDKGLSGGHSRCFRSR